MIRVITEVICDMCYQHHGGTSGKKRNTKKAMDKARFDGWVHAASPFNGTPADFCPDCKKKYLHTRNST